MFDTDIIPFKVGFNLQSTYKVVYHRDRFDQENRQKNFIRKGEKRLEAKGKIPGVERVGGSGIMATWCVGEQDLLFDLKMMIKQYYVATFTQQDNRLKLTLSNGQTFLITVSEQK